MRILVAPALAAFDSVVTCVAAGLSVWAIVAVSWLAPESMTTCWPGRSPHGAANRRPAAPTAVAVLSVVVRALFASWSITVERSANEVVTANTFVYFDVLPPLSWSDAVSVCLPTVSVLSDSAFGITCVPSTVIRRGDDPPAPLETVSVGSFRRGSAKIGVRICDWRILPSTTCGTYTDAPLMWFFASALVSTTLGAGAAGAGLTTPAIRTVSALAPRSIWSVSPAARPVRLARRICVSPAAAAGGPAVPRRTPRRPVVRLQRRRRRAPDRHRALRVDQHRDRVVELRADHRGVRGVRVGQRRRQRPVGRRRGGSRRDDRRDRRRLLAGARVDQQRVAGAATGRARQADRGRTHRRRLVQRRVRGRAAGGVAGAVHCAVAHRRVALLRHRHRRRRRRTRGDRDVDVRRSAVQRVLELGHRDVVGGRQVQRLGRR